MVQDPDYTANAIKVSCKVKVEVFYFRFFLLVTDSGNQSINQSIAFPGGSSSSSSSNFNERFSPNIIKYITSSPGSESVWVLPFFLFAQYVVYDRFFLTYFGDGLILFCRFCRFLQTETRSSRVFCTQSVRQTFLQLFLFKQFKTVRWWMFSLLAVLQLFKCQPCSTFAIVS